MTLIRPMLAKRFAPRYWKDGGMFCQPKLNGVRCMYQDGVFMARDGNAWSPKCLVHLRHALRNVDPRLILDGELYCHGLSLQQINARIAVNRVVPHPQEEDIQYHVFDFVSDAPFYLRRNNLLRVFEPLRNPSVVCVGTLFAPDLEQAMKVFSVHKQHGYEGAMLRDPSAGYSVPATCTNKENRVTSLLKLKDWFDVDATILEVCEGEGRFLGMTGSLHCTLPNGKTFNVGSGLSDRERSWLWTHRDLVTGWKVKVRYEMFSDTGIPLKPTIIQVPNLCESW